MTWVKLDDSFPNHPRIHGLSDRAFRLYITGLCYSAHYLTDGKLTPKSLRSLGKVATKRELIEAGLWIETDDGNVTIRDYLEYNPTAAEVKEKRQKNTERVTNWRKRNAVRNAVTNTVTNENVTPLVTHPPSHPIPSNASSTKKRAHDEVWDALIVVMSREPLTASERGAWNRAAKELREAGASAEQIIGVAAGYRREWPDVELTPSALAKHWGRFLSARVVALKPFLCEECPGGLRFRTEALLVEHRENVHGEWRRAG